MPAGPPLPATAPYQVVRATLLADQPAWSVQHDGTAGRLAVRGAAIWYVGCTGSRFEVTPVEGVGPPSGHSSSQPG